MRLKSFMYTLVASISVINLSACQVAEYIFYEHEPSNTFYERMDKDAPELKPYVTDDIIFVVTFKATNYRTEHIVWLGLYSLDRDKRVTIKTAIIESGSWQQENSFNELIVLDEKTTIDPNYVYTRDDYYKKGVKLFQIEQDILEKAYQDGNAGIRVRIFYETNNQENYKEYKLIRRVEKYNVYPT